MHITQLFNKNVNDGWFQSMIILVYIEYSISKEKRFGVVTYMQSMPYQYGTRKASVRLEHLFQSPYIAARHI